MGATTLDPVADKLGVYNASENRLDEATITEVMRSLYRVAASGVTGDMNGNNVQLTLASQRADTGWAIAGNVMSFTGAPDHVDISAMAYGTGGGARSSPELLLVKNGDTANPIAISGTGYIRNSGGHDSSSNTISFRDVAPGSNPTYQLIARRGATNTTAVPIVLGSFSAKATL